ncbi:MAG: nucleotidyltransferase domain-containing protein [Anaerolineales bacterium]|nr:nucleotidyltransferase domain-containing protein [Anaerolineales bacterium]MCB8937969.1 nucleotidyltransferase domain-containing protein [Ardenticatenaceae bacterium]
MVAQPILDNIQRYIHALEQHGLSVSQVALFGSYASGQTNEWSDIDLIVISPSFDGSVSIEDVNLLWHTTLEVDNRIEPIACGQKQWQEDMVTPLLNVARREGIVIKPVAEPA